MRSELRKILQLLVFALLASLVGCDNGDASSQGGPVAMRRLTPEQYRNAVGDLFGAMIDVSGRFEPDNRRAGLNAIGTSLVAVTPSGFEQYEAMARNIAAQVTSTEHRDHLLPCQPQAATAPDDACTERIVRSLGRQLLRRPLGDDEVAVRVKAASATAAVHADFYAGLGRHNPGPG